MNKRKKRKDPNEPKRPVSAYMFFVQHERNNCVNEFKSKGQELSFPDIGRELGKKWKLMTDAQKRPYQDMNARDKMRHEQEMKEYTPPEKQRDSDSDDSDDDSDSDNDKRKKNKKHKKHKKSKKHKKHKKHKKAKDSSSEDESDDSDGSDGSD